MKFFTPELYARFVSNNDRIADRAQIEWERALDSYGARLRRIRPELPRGIRRLVDELRLHDAVLLHEISFGNRCLLTLRLESPDDHIVVLDYKTTEPPESMPVPLPPEALSESPLFVFDEIERIGSRNGKPVFQHSILFGHGHLFVIRCLDVRISIGEEVLPLAGELTAASAARFNLN